MKLYATMDMLDKRDQISLMNCLKSPFNVVEEFLVENFSLMLAVG